MYHTIDQQLKTNRKILKSYNKAGKATIDKTGVRVNSEARCVGKTGIEMEALTAVSVALLTVYDMCKAVDKKMVISEIKLISKVKEDLK